VRGAARGAALATLASLLLLAPVRTLAEEVVEDVITMGYGEGTVGQRGVRVIVTATNGEAIHGYSIAFTYPAEVLRLTNVSTAGTHVAVLEPDFVGGSMEDDLGIGTLGVIFPFSEPFSMKELPPLAPSSYPRIIARLTFDVKEDAPGGIYPLELVDGIGQPASFNRFTVGGTSVAPRLESGSFRVAGGNVLTMEKKIAFPGIASTQKLKAYAQHPRPLDGFQIGFTFPKSAVDIKDVSFGGTDLGFELGRTGKIEAFAWNIDRSFSASEGRVAVACLFDIQQPIEGQTLSACGASPTCQSLVEITAAVSANADQLSQYLDLTLADTGIAGVVDNRFIIGDQSVDPQLSSGKIYFSTGFLQGRVVDSVTLSGVGGVSVMTDPDGFTAVTGFDGTFRIAGIQSAGIAPGRYELLLSRSGYYSSRHRNGADGVGPIIVAGQGATGSVGDVPLFKIPVTAGVKFQRARVNEDPRTDLSDAVFLLNHLFRGAEEPPCVVAADINDDEKMDISDAIYLLSYLFVGGPNPPPPYSDEGTVCEPDPTPGPLSCERFTICQ
jgi:hypothetical protein